MVWGLIQTAVMAAYYGLIMWWSLKMFAQMPSVGTGAGAPPSAVGPAIAMMFQAQAIFYLGLLALMIVYSIVICAAFRACLAPADNRFASLRLGATEWSFAFAWFVFIVLVILAEIVFGIPLMLVLASLIASKATAAATGVGLVGGSIFLIGIVYLHLRLGLAWPMIVDTGKFRLFESWSLTRGAAGSMFLIALVLIVGLIVVEGILAVVGFGVAAAMAGGSASPPSVTDLPAYLARLEPMFIIAAILGIPVLGALLAIFIAPWAYVYRQIGVGAVEAPFT